MDEQTPHRRIPAELLSAYVPIDRRHAMVADVDLSQRPHGAVLFADISGFTPLTEAIERDFGPRRGGEELTRHLNEVYGALIDEVHRFRGSVIGFSGDAITCWFEGDDGTRATACGLLLHQVMRRFQGIKTPSDATYALSIKVAVVSGTVRRILAGDPQVQVIDVLAGDLLDRMAQAEQLAQRGELIVGAEVLAGIGDRTTVVQWRSAASGERFAVIDAAAGLPAATPWAAVDVHALDEEQLRPWLLPQVYQRLQLGQGDFLAELRPAVALFLRFQGLDFETDDAVAEKLDAYIRWTQGVLQRYEGSLIQLTTGDKGSYLYSVFGAPIAHEDEVQRALSAAVVLRSPPPELRFVKEIQIGIGRGRMRTGGYGSETRRTYGVLGDATNVAARIMSKAAPGQILVSEQVAKVGRARYRFEPVDTVTLKGKQAPISLFELRDRRGRTRPANGRHERRNTIVGRKAEREFLYRALNRLQENRGGAVIVVGEAGIGKSRLISDLLDKAQVNPDAPITCFVASTDALENTTAHYAWRPVFAQLLGIDRLSDPREIQARVLQRLPKDLVALAPLLNAVLDVEFAAEATPQARKSPLTARIGWFLASVFRALASAQPVLLVVEDAHWLDSSSWNLLDLIRRDMSTLLLVLTTRPLETPPERYQDLVVSPDTECLKLEAMLPEDALALVRHRLGVKHLPDSVATLIRDKAEGNPFFSEELAYSLRDAGFISIENGVCRAVQELDQMDFPDTIEGIVTSRIDRLTPSQQLALKVASVLGRAFTFSTLRDVFPVQEDREQLPAFVQHLARLDLTPLETPKPEPKYFFKHAITQEVAYNLMLFEQRRVLHRAVADWYERAYKDDLAPFYNLLAHHRWKAIEGLSEPEPEQIQQAVDALVNAGKHCLERGATPEAILHLSKGLQLLDSLPESRERTRIEIEIRFSLGAALVVTRGPTHEDVQHEFERARQLCREIGEMGRLFEAIFGMWYFNFIQSNPKGAIEFAEQLVQIARAADKPELQFLAQEAYGSTMICDGNYREGLQCMRQALDFANRASGNNNALAQARDPIVMAYTYCAWANWFLGYPSVALEEVQTSITLAKKVAHPLTLTQALTFGAMVRRFRREVDAAEALGQQALDLATKHGFPYWVAVTTSIVGWVSIERGHPERAVPTLRSSLEMANDISAGMFSIVALADLVTAFTQMQRFEEAAAALDEAQTLLATRLAGFCGPEIERLAGELWRRQADLARAETCLHRAMDAARAQQMRSIELRTAISLAGVWRQQGKLGEASKLVSDIYFWFTEGFDTRDLMDARALLDELEHHNGDLSQRL